LGVFSVLVALSSFGKPLPYQEQALNTVATDARHFFHALFPGTGQFRASPSFDSSAFLCMCGMIHANLARGDRAELTFFGFLHPKFVRAMKYYRLNALFTSVFMTDSWMQRNDLDEDAFASLKIFSCGGSYPPQDRLRNYIDCPGSAGRGGRRGGASGARQRFFGDGLAERSCLPSQFVLVNGIPCIPTARPTASA
jgi:hypothetical protein